MKNIRAFWHQYRIETSHHKQKSISDFKQSKIFKRLNDNFNVIDKGYKFQVDAGEKGFWQIFPDSGNVFCITTGEKFKGYSTLKKRLFK